MTADTPREPVTEARSSQGIGQSPARRYSDRGKPYSEAIQEIADEADADLHGYGCRISQEDPDSCSCALRFYLEWAAALDQPDPHKPGGQLGTIRLSIDPTEAGE